LDPLKIEHNRKMTSEKLFVATSTDDMWLVDSEEPVQCKILLLGDYAVGKTSLIQRLVLLCFFILIKSFW
jgi:GTPase SAR1 family protein